jgi:hypothetical protein
MEFNRKPITYGKVIDEPSTEVLRNTLGLVNSSAEDAIRYGGEVTKAALSVLPIKNNRKYVIVDVKVHMLKPGFSPAIPGWHTDGVPRGERLNPLSNEEPDIFAQDCISNGITKIDNTVLRPTHFHMLVTGQGCLTEFIHAPRLSLEERSDWNTAKLYSDITEQVEALELPRVHVPSCAAVSFDWWDLHRGITATKNEWRYFIRVTETDLCHPETDLRKVIRTQQQVYAPANFGW